ncbi:MAG: ATP-grasp domain-containing protein [Planctomycetota bacterium]|jgi:carbamoyl-phosphate synthase large subunit
MSKANLSRSKNIKVLFTCIGRRVSLLRSFRSAAKRLKLKAQFFGADITELSSALQLCDRKFLVKPTTHSGYISQLLSIVQKHKINLIIPTVDLDLKVLAQAKQRFSELGCLVLISGPEVIDICQDKRKTFQFLSKNGFDTPVTMSPKKALSAKSLNLPYFLKPWDGYASRGNAVIKNRRELQVFSKRIPNCIVQEFVEGNEFTCDVYVDFDLNVRCVVPRKRIEVRSGEVNKGQIVKDKRIMKKAGKLVEILRAGPGVITIQLIRSKKGELKFIEINPRFGGGVPLSIKAGADFPYWVLSEMLSRKPRIRFDGFKDQLVMLRYDDEVWFE